MCRKACGSIRSFWRTNPLLQTAFHPRTLSGTCRWIAARERPRSSDGHRSHLKLTSVDLEAFQKTFKSISPFQSPLFSLCKLSTTCYTDRVSRTFLIHQINRLFRYALFLPFLIKDISSFTNLSTLFKFLYHSIWAEWLGLLSVLRTFYHSKKFVHRRNEHTNCQGVLQNYALNNLRTFLNAIKIQGKSKLKSSLLFINGGKLIWVQTYCFSKLNLPNRSIKRDIDVIALKAPQYLKHAWSSSLSNLL